MTRNKPRGTNQPTATGAKDATMKHMRYAFVLSLLAGRTGDVFFYLFEVREVYLCDIKVYHRTS